ncbi:hypothetical protein AGMMS49983_13650 [Clostridia bacterium]|nr:hypothetical protein AGMMS49983_13650 [Clostridia bacterium]
MRITWFNNASILIEENGERLLFDPFVPFDGAENPTSIDTYLALNAKHILITHGHLDHLLNVPELAVRSDVQIYCTQTPARTLRKYGVSESQITVIKPGDHLSFSRETPQSGPATLPSFEADVKQGRHVRFDPPLVLRTLFNRRMFQYKRGRRLILQHHKNFPERGEAVIFEIHACGTAKASGGAFGANYDGGKCVQVIGSMSLDTKETYRQRADCLILPYQGHTDMVGTALTLAKKLFPRKILLDHFDDAFPPVSGHGVDTAAFLEAMSYRHNEVEVIVPQAGVPIDID